MKIDLYNGDCLEVIDKLIEQGVKVDLILTDPPYEITKRGNHGNFGGMMKTEQSMKGKIFKHNDIKISDYISKFYDLLNDNSHMYIMTNDKNLNEFENEITKAGFKITRRLIWDKGNKICGSYYMAQHEYIIFARKGKAKKINKPGTSSILSVPNKKTKIGGKNIHDTEKPVKLMEILIENSTLENQLALDPFMGSGTTGIACRNTGRDFIGIEIEEKYFEIAKNRINKGE